MLIKVKCSYFKKSINNLLCIVILILLAKLIFCYLTYIHQKEFQRKEINRLEIYFALRRNDAIIAEICGNRFPE